MRACESSSSGIVKEYSIYNVDFGTGKGHEQSYPRPAIIFKALHELSMCLVIPLTSNLNHLNLPYTIQVNKTSVTNLREDSIALIFQLRVIDNGRISGNEIGKLEEYQISKIKTIMKEMLAL